MNRIFLFVILPVVIFGCSRNNATIEERKEAFVTYPFYDPDPIPRPERNFYPYFRFDGYSIDSESVEWNVVELENAYVKVHVFPEIGGKVWGAIEKSTGNDFVYYNNVVKFRNIAMRGPWTSGGIEMNFGVIGHTPAVSTPVDYQVMKNDDGSVSCFVGTIDLLTRTRWETEVNLHPDNAYFTTNTRWSNTTPHLQPYYQWSNAAYQSEGDLELIFPGTHRLGHGGEANTWPVDETGKDLSYYRNNDFGGDKSNHIIGGTHDFYVGYWHDLDFGAGHYSQYGDKLGKKVWLWSTARSGGIWEDLLTDSDGQYVELQSGRLFNQASTSSTRTPFKHFGFSPHTSDEFKEYWYPVMNIGGVVKANNLGALNIVKGPENQTIYLSPLQPVNDVLNVYFGDELKYSFKLNLKPLEIWQTDISVNPASQPLEIIVGAGKELVYSEKVYNTVPLRPLEAPEDFDWNSVYGLYTDGVNWIYQNRFDRAYESLRACLELDPNYAPALNHMAELYLRRSDYDNALANLIKSLSINAYDPQANFLFGVVNRMLGNLIDAQDGFAVASITPDYRMAGFIELAKLFILKDELLTASTYVDRVLENESGNQDALLLKSIILRKDERGDEAVAYLDRLEKISPLNHFARFEKMLLKDNRTSEGNFTALIRNELPRETYMEMALWYDYIGCSNEAVRLLEMSPATAMGYLRLSYLYDSEGDRENSDLNFEKAISHSTEFVFPFRTESVPLLEWAISKTSNWKPKYYLGLLQWRFGNKELARDLFAECGQEPESASFYMAKTELFVDMPGYDSEADLLRAGEIEIGEWRISQALIDYYLGKNSVEKALEISRESLDMFPSNDALKYTYAKCLLANGHYSESLNELENTVILPNEGARAGRITYRQAAVMEGIEHLNAGNMEGAANSIAKARMWPENLGVGRPYNVDERLEDFLEAEILMQRGERDQANILYNKVITYTQSRSDRYNSTDFLNLVVLKRMGMNQQANDFLAQWQQRSSNDPVLRWTRAMLNNNRSLAMAIEREIVTEAGGTPWDPRYGDSEFELVKAVSGQMDLNFR